MLSHSLSLHPAADRWVNILCACPYLLTQCADYQRRARAEHRAGRVQRHGNSGTDTGIGGSFSATVGCAHVPSITCWKQSNQFICVTVCAAQKHELNLSFFWSVCQVISVSTYQRRRRNSVFQPEEREGTVCAQSLVNLFYHPFRIFFFKVTFICQQREKSC